MTTFHPTHGRHGHGRISAAAPHTGFHDRALIRALLGTSALVLALAAWPAAAAAPNTAPDTASNTAGAADLAQMPAGKTAAFDIPAQALPTALNAFGRQAGVQVTVDAALTQGRQAPAVKGEMTTADALDRLLRGTGITWTFSDPKTVALSRPGANGDRITLGTVSVEGRAVPRQAEIGTLPPAYVGGQVARGGKLGILGNRDMMDTPFSQTNYTAKLLTDQHASNAIDVLDNDPSVEWAQLPSTGFTNLGIRGFRLSGESFLFDGVPNLSSGNVGGLMMAESLERVEVLRGPSALINGNSATSNTVGGAVNLVPKRAGDQPLTRVTGKYISDEHFGGHADIGRRFGKDNQFGIRVNAAYNGGELAIDHSSQETQVLSLAADYRGDRIRVSGDFGYQDQHTQGARRQLSLSNNLSAVPDAPDSRTNTSAPYEFNDFFTYYGVVQAEGDFTPNITGFAKLGGLFAKRESIFANYTINDTDGNMSGTPRVAGDEFEQWTTQMGLRGNFDTGPVNHQMSVAYTYAESQTRRPTNTPTLTSESFNLYNPSFGADQAVGSIFRRPNTSADFPTAVLADTLSVHDGRAQLTLGVRWQRIDSTSFDLSTGAVSSAYAKEAITPMVGFVVKPWDNVSVYTNYVEALEQGGTAPDGTTNAGEIFAPFMSKGYEAGVKADWGKFATTLAVYQISRPSAFTDTDTNTYVQDGNERHRGVELGIFGEVANGVRVLGGASFVDAILSNTANGTNDGNKAVAAPFQLRLGAEWDTPFLEGLTLTGRVMYNYEQNVNQSNTLEIPDWYRFDIGARYTIDRQGLPPITLRATVTNVLNSNYWIGSSFGAVLIGDPRTFKLSASFDF
ncbi:MAG: TonB-dependent receptor [Rhodospirillales bacterium]